MLFRYSLLHPIRDLLFKQNQPDKALEELQPFLSRKDLAFEEKRAVFQLAGLIKMKQMAYQDALKYFNQIQDNYLSGYCELLQGNLQNIQAYWGPLVQTRMNHWCISLFGLVTMQLNSFPTMFQVRNHLESDIYNLITAGQHQMVNHILSYSDFLTQANLETPKFIGRALLNISETDSQWIDMAGTLLLKAQKILPNDPEIYYHLGQYRVFIGDTDDACRVLKQCLMMSETYTPAQQLLTELEAA